MPAPPWSQVLLSQCGLFFQWSWHSNGHSSNPVLQVGLVNLAVYLAGEVNCQWSGVVLAHIQVGAESTHSGLIPLSLVEPISIYTRGLLLLVTEGWMPSFSASTTIRLHMISLTYMLDAVTLHFHSRCFTFVVLACTPFLYARVDTTNYATNISSCNSPCLQLEVSPLAREYMWGKNIDNILIWYCQFHKCILLCIKSIVLFKILWWIWSQHKSQQNILDIPLKYIHWNGIWLTGIGHMTGINNNCIQKCCWDLPCNQIH